MQVLTRRNLVKRATDDALEQVTAKQTMRVWKSFDSGSVTVLERTVIGDSDVLGWIANTRLANLEITVPEYDQKRDEPVVSSACRELQPRCDLMLLFRLSVQLEWKLHMSNSRLTRNGRCMAVVIVRIIAYLMDNGE